MMEDKKRYFYDTIADDFDSIMDMYDTRKRLRIIFDEMLPDRLNGKRIPDAGCGTGWIPLIPVHTLIHTQDARLS